MHRRMQPWKYIKYINLWHSVEWEYEYAVNKFFSILSHILLPCSAFARFLNRLRHRPILSPVIIVTGSIFASHGTPLLRVRSRLSISTSARAGSSECVSETQRDLKCIIANWDMVSILLGEYGQDTCQTRWFTISLSMQPDASWIKEAYYDLYFKRLCNSQYAYSHFFENDKIKFLSVIYYEDRNPLS